MDGTRITNKKYSVVKFISDSTYSEIPKRWLEKKDNKQLCWWPPRTANAAILIANCSPPDMKSWNQYEVDIIKSCSSLESARKSAADSDYQTTDEEKLGQGKRLHVVTNSYFDNNSDDEDSEDDEIREPQTSKNKNKSYRKQILQMQTSTILMLQDIKKNINYIQDILRSHILPSTNINYTLIAQCLPLDTINNIKEFESLMKNTEEAVIQFKQYLLQIGENNPRNNIHRILSKIFTENCAINCSWKGTRNNFKVCDLYFIKIMREEITSQHTDLTETQFNIIVKEWFRFAKQRKRTNNKDKKNIGEVQYNAIIKQYRQVSNMTTSSRRRKRPKSMSIKTTKRLAKESRTQYSPISSPKLPSLTHNQSNISAECPSTSSVSIPIIDLSSPSPQPPQEPDQSPESETIQMIHAYTITEALFELQSRLSDLQSIPEPENQP